MAKFSIYSKDGNTIRYSGEPQFSSSYMGVEYVEFRNVSSPFPIEWERGDFVDYYRTGLRYRLYTLPTPKKLARRGEYGASFEYASVQFHAATKELEIAPFRDIVTDDNKVHFSTRADVSTYENVYGIARRVQACLDDIFPDRWRIEVFDTDDENLLALFNEAKEFSVSSGNCLDALSQIYETWKNVGWIHTYDSSRDMDVITIGRANVRDSENTSDEYSYGLGKGLTSIRKATANEGEFATRLYVYGSERNIQTRYYNGLDILNKDSVDIRNLMIPVERWGKTNGLPDAKKAYLQADESIIAKYGLIPRTVYFDGNGNEEIYPSITGLTMAEVRDAMIEAGQQNSEYLPQARTHRIDQIDEAYQSSFGDGSKEDTEKNMTFSLGLRMLGFDLAKEGKKTSEGYAIISMKSGPCAGREFKVRKFSGMTYTKADGTVCMVYDVEKSWDESVGMGFPNATFPINDGDEFVLLDIPMPDFYIALAEDRLYEAGQKMLADYTRVSAFYEPTIDSIRIKEGGEILRAGMYMQVYDEDIIDTADNRDYVLIDSLTIDEKSALPAYKITLREQKRSSRSFSALEDMIVDAKEETRELVKKERQYTERRFKSAQETLDMIASAFDDFSTGIDPVTIKTMAALVGDESLQFIFTDSIDSLEDIPCPLAYEASTKQMNGSACALVHMTLGVDDVTVKYARNVSDYKRWNTASWNSAILEDDSKAYYVYVKARLYTTEAEYILSTKPRKMYDEEYDVANYYFLVGILNSEAAGTREFVTVYGFTEILPGQITTDIIRSADGKTYFDLANNEIGGKIRFASTSTGLTEIQEFKDVKTSISNIKRDLAEAERDLENTYTKAEADGKISEAEQSAIDEAQAKVDAAKQELTRYTDDAVQNIGGQNMLRNSGFTGDYLSKSMADGIVLEEASRLDNDPLVHWDVNGSIEAVELDGVSASKSGVYGSGTIQQKLVNSIIEGESYVVTFKAAGDSSGEEISVSCAGASETVILEDSWQKFTVRFVANYASDVFILSLSNCTLCEIQLERGTTATAWGNSIYDNSSDRTYYQSLKYLADALKGSTVIDGGLVLANTIRLGEESNASEFVERAGSNGLYLDEDSPAFYAGGTLEQADETARKYESGGYASEDEIAFVVTHGGKMILNKAFIRKGCHIGDSIRVIENGIELDTKSDDVEGLVRISETDGVQSSNGKLVSRFGGAGCSNIMIQAATMGAAPYCPSKPTPIGVWGDEDGNAILCGSGMFAGLRTTAVYIEDLRSPYGGYVFDNTISNILFPSSGTYDISLDSFSPASGQEIWFETMGADINVTSTIPMWSHVNGAYETSHPFASRGVIRFKYYGGKIKDGKGVWTYTWVESH